MSAQRKYPEELRERATRMAVEARRDPERSKGAIRRIAEELGVHPEALRTWVKKAEIDAGARPGTTTSDAERIRQLEKEVRELRRANAILRSASVVLRGRSQAARPADLRVHRLPQREELRGLCRFCQALTSADVKIAPSTTCAARTRPPSARAVRDQALKAEISRVHEKNYCAGGRPQDARHAEPA